MQGPNPKSGYHRMSKVCGVSKAHLIWMDHEDGLPVELLHLVRRDQVGHAHGPPAGLALPQHRVQCGQQRADVPLLALDPV